jgi:hypothetical protein
MHDLQGSYDRPYTCSGGVMSITDRLVTQVSGPQHQPHPRLSISFHVCCTGALLQAAHRTWPPRIVVDSSPLAKRGLTWSMRLVRAPDTGVKKSVLKMLRSGTGRLGTPAAISDKSRKHRAYRSTCGSMPSDMHVCKT